MFDTYAEYSDSFIEPIKPKLHVLKKYQYLGFIKGPDVYLGFVRLSGGGVETVKYGKNPGFGNVVSIDNRYICILYHREKWCLYRSNQVKPWHKEL